jgi:hypothetical protein
MKRSLVQIQKYCANVCSILLASTCLGSSDVGAPLRKMFVDGENLHLHVGFLTLSKVRERKGTQKNPHWMWAASNPVFLA